MASDYLGYSTTINIRPVSNGYIVTFPGGVEKVYTTLESMLKDVKETCKEKENERE